MNSLKNTKIDLSNHSKEDRELFQRIAFACGCYWIDDDKNDVRFLEEPYVFICGQNTMSFAEHDEYFDFKDNSNKEIKLKELTPPDNADLMWLQSKGVKFNNKGIGAGIWDFSGLREYYVVNLPSVFEEVQQEVKVGERWKVSLGWYAPDAKREADVRINYVSKKTLVLQVIGSAKDDEEIWARGAITFIEKLEGEE